MVNIRRYLRQTCYYWPIAGRNNQGDPIYGDVRKLKCRWDDVAEQFYPQNGVEVTVSKSKVMVNEELEVGGVLLLSQNKDVDNWSDLIFRDEPWNEENGRSAEIRQFSNIPDRAARTYVRIAWL
jgi:hypothetical protein